MNLVPSGLNDAPPSSLKCIGGGIEKDLTVERSDIFKNITYGVYSDGDCDGDLGKEMTQER